MFITIEGPEGSGKTSVMNIVCERLLADGYPIIRTREPGGTPIAEQIRDIILDKANTALDARAEALLYAASRRQHLVEKVWPALNKGNIIICDRYLDSSLAYQGGARGLGVNQVLKVNLFATEGCLPDLTLLFDIDPKVGLSRINKTKNREVNRLDLEQLSFHRKVRKTFLKLAKKEPNRFVIIDASKSFDEVVTNAEEVIRLRLGKR
ncbi:MAG TPA: dTMP kinase [Firmicutes bacterium]|jgi:dTMP kinase|nr:dTMP kinase [Bacillota bacterium]